MSIEDLTSIYKIVYESEAGKDPFQNPKIQHLKQPLEAYFCRQPERHQALSMQPRIVSEPEEASADFDLLIVPADSARNVEEVKLRCKTQMLRHEVPHYRVLAARFKDLPSDYDASAKAALLALLAYEIRFLRGSDITWVGGSFCSFAIPSQGAASGPC